jgi:hypothetical protein
MILVLLIYAVFILLKKLTALTVDLTEEVYDSSKILFFEG